LSGYRCSWIRYQKGRSADGQRRNAARMDLEKADVRHDLSRSDGVPFTKNEGNKGQRRIPDQYEQLKTGHLLPLHHRNPSADAEGFLFLEGSTFVRRDKQHEDFLTKCIFIDLLYIFIGLLCIFIDSKCIHLQPN